MHGCFLLDGFLDLSVFIVLHHLKLEVDTLDCNHVALAMDSCHLALSALVLTGIYNNLVSEHYLPVQEWFLFWAVSEHPHRDLALEH